MSTLELQLASLEFCAACRSTPILRVRVTDQTRRSLWSPRKAQTGRYMTRSKVRISSRVLVVRAFRLAWELPMKVLLESAATELWKRSEYLYLQGAVPPAGRLEPVVWPKRLKHLTFNTGLKTVMEAGLWPEFLIRLALLGGFDEPIAGVECPSSLQQLEIEDKFD